MVGTFIKGTVLISLGYDNNINYVAYKLRTFFSHISEG